VVYYLESFDPALVRSAIPNYMLAEMASDYVKVMLTGEGADELYAGYSYLQRFEKPDDLQKELVYITEALHNTNLQRGDRMSMAHGLEARVPFLDVESVSMALSLPSEWKLHDDDRPAKSLLRRAFEGHLPDEIVYRPKMKFSKGAGSSDRFRTVSSGKKRNACSVIGITHFPTRKLCCTTRCCEKIIRMSGSCRVWAGVAACRV